LKPLAAGGGVEAARRAVRRRVSHLDGDRVMANDIAMIRVAVDDQSVRRAAEKITGKLK
jgi:histidine ammonia-lyase